MLYELKRTFGKGLIDLDDTLFDMVGVTGASQDVYAGDLDVDETPATAGYLDYEKANQHFPNENTLEIWGKETADSSGDTATVTITLQDSADANTFGDLYSLTLLQAVIIDGNLLFRATIPAHARRYLRLKVVTATEAFTAGKLLAFVRPL
ncbi:MAG: hypothetical protein GX585_05910 [Clostridiales bacterium]|nr:hypothetical protein [Clostridiales bacterium]